MEHIRSLLPSGAAAKARKATVSAVLPSGELVEMVYDPLSRTSALCRGNPNGARLHPEIQTDTGLLVPFNGTNNLLTNDVVLFASQPEEYGDERALVTAVQEFIHRYVDVGPRFERLATHYVLLTWVYDSFGELPYLRLLGEPGTGKTRFLLTVGSLCYKPIFASGASTVSPLFRLADIFRGTLVVDEADFRVSDERADLVKVLNNGNAVGFPVLRSEATANGKEFNPRAYVVYGPKLVATRHRFHDAALESRCLTEEMGRQRLRPDVPINLPPSYKEEALRLRNQLLTFRLRHGGTAIPIRETVDPAIEPRLNQVFAPLLAIMEDSAARADLRALAREYHRDLVADRGQESEARVLEIIRDLRTSGIPVTVGAIADIFSERHGIEYERKITPKWIGYLLRRRLYLRTRKSDGNFVLTEDAGPTLDALFARYGIQPEGPGTKPLRELDGEQGR